MVTIKIICNYCKVEHTVDRTQEISPKVDYLKCNWCPECEDRAATQDYKEWNIYKKKEKIIDIKPLSLF